MSANSYKIKIGSGSATTINIPIVMTFQPIDQAEVVERDFVEKEIENSINPITDFEKVRFIPVDSNNVQIDSLIYKINLLDGATFPTTTMYSHADFEYNDVRFGKNSFKRSFLRLSFYDSDIPTNQNLMSFMTLFCKLTVNDIIPLTQNITTSTPFGPVTLPAPVPNGGLPNPITSIPIRFIVEDPIKFPDGISEGYNIYHFKDDVSDTLPKELFMRASWNNAKTGESIALITDGTPQTINNLVSKLHMKYILKRDNTGWWYEIDETYSTNISLVGGIQTLELYQVQAI